MIHVPKQSTIRHNSDHGDLHEALDEAMFYIREAMEDIKGFGEMQDTFAALSDIHDDMYAVYEDCEVNINAQYADLVREMSRDYYRNI